MTWGVFLLPNLVILLINVSALCELDVKIKSMLHFFCFILYMCKLSNENGQELLFLVSNTIVGWNL